MRKGMNTIIIVNRIQDLFSLRLLSLLIQKSKEFLLYPTAEIDFDSILTEINALHDESKKGIFQKFLDKINSAARFSPEEIKEKYTGCKIVFWFFEKKYLLHNLFGEYYWRQCKKERSKAAEYAKLAGADEFNAILYLHGKICSLDSDNNGDSDTKMRINTYLLPPYIGDETGDLLDGAGNSLRQKIGDFVQWIDNRISSFFVNESVHYVKDPACIVNYLTAESAAFTIYDTYIHAKKRDAHNFEMIGHWVDFDSILEKMFAETFGICIQWVNKMEELTPADHILKDIIDAEKNDLAGYMDAHNDKDNQAVRRCVLDNTDFCLFSSQKKRESIFQEFGAERKLNKTNTVKSEKTKRSAGDNAIEYFVVGEGSPIFIINAYGVDVDAWSRLTQRLSAQHKLIYYTANVFSQGQKFDDNFAGVEEQVKNIESIVAAENLSSFDMISWCSGAKSAVYYYIKNPKRVKSQIYIAGEFAPYEGSAPYHSKFRENIQLIAEIINKNPKMTDFYMKIISGGLFNHPLQTYTKENIAFIFDVVPAVYRDVLLAPFQTKDTMVRFLKMCIEYYQHDVTALLPKIQCPTLFIGAQYDRVAPYMQSQWAHEQVLQSKYYCVPAATHLMILERTDLVSQLIKQFLDINFQNK